MISEKTEQKIYITHYEIIQLFFGHHCFFYLISTFSHRLWQSSISLAIKMRNVMSLKQLFALRKRRLFKILLSFWYILIVMVSNRLSSCYCFHAEELEISEFDIYSAFYEIIQWVSVIFIHSWFRHNNESKLFFFAQCYFCEKEVQHLA
jgi:hypothetical protein